MPHYTFDMSRHVKIWLSPDSEVFLPLLHQWRLQDIRVRYPQIAITLVYSRHCLSEGAVQALEQFCKQYHIIPRALETDPIFKDLLAKEGHKLYLHAMEELSSFKLQKGGNLGAASDLLRWVTRVLEQGIYSDLDMNITVHPRQLKFYSDTPLLLNICPDNRRCYNNILAFLGDHQQRDLIDEVRKQLESAYGAPLTYLQKKQKTITKSDYCFGDTLQLLLSSETYRGVVKKFTVPKLRKWIEDNFLKDEKSYMYAHDFMKAMLAAENQPEDHKGFFVANKKQRLREHLSGLPPEDEKTRNLIQWFLSIEQAPQFLSKYFAHIQQQTRLGLVTYFSGAPHLMCLKEKGKGLSKYSLLRQRLEDCFRPFSEKSDLAWLPGEAGQLRWEQHQAAELQKMQAAHLVLQKTVQPQLYAGDATSSTVTATASQQSVISELSADALALEACLEDSILKKYV